jgi:hypothetical protein
VTNDEKFAAMLADNRAAFEKDPIAALKAAGIPLLDRPPPQPRRPDVVGADRAAANVPAPAAAAGGGAGEQVSVDTYWWGIDIVCNEKLTSDIINGSIATGVLGGSIAAAFGVAGIITGGAATVIGAALASAFALKVYEMQLVDDGNGVYWPISWLQWAGVIVAAAGGPVGVTAALMVYIHPVRN